MTRTAPFFIVCLFFGTLHADDDEVRFKKKTYEPGRSLTTQTYREKTYAPSAASASTGTSWTAPKEKKTTAWSWFSPKKETPSDVPLEKTEPLKSEAYAQQKQITVPTISPDPTLVPEKKPFDEKGKKVTENAAYKPPEKSNEKNPLLEPRQDIRLHP